MHRIVVLALAVFLAAAAAVLGDPFGDGVTFDDPLFNDGPLTDITAELQGGLKLNLPRMHLGSPSPQDGAVSSTSSYSSASETECVNGDCSTKSAHDKVYSNHLGTSVIIGRQVVGNCKGSECHKKEKVDKGEESCHGLNCHGHKTVKECSDGNCSTISQAPAAPKKASALLSNVDPFIDI